MDGINGIAVAEGCGVLSESPVLIVATSAAGSPVGLSPQGVRNGKGGRPVTTPGRVADNVPLRRNNDDNLDSVEYFPPRRLARRDAFPTDTAAT